MLEEQAASFEFEPWPWEDSDWIITMRKHGDLPWLSVPIGPVMNYSEIAIVNKWLTEGGLTVLWQIADNIVRDNENTQEKHTDNTSSERSSDSF